jgi:hypothetical protein
MRSLTVSVLCALLLIMTPKPALAWFGWIDSLSGPGPFEAGGPARKLIKGGDFDFRIVCFMPHSSLADAALASQLAAARTVADREALSALGDDPKVQPALPYRDVELGSWADRFVSESAASLADLTATYAARVVTYERDRKVHVDEKTQEVISAWQRAAHLWRTNTVPSVSWLPGSILWARCADHPKNDPFSAALHQDRLPSSSIGFNYRRLFANYDESPTVPYAGGHRIQLEIFEPKFSLPLSGRFDFLDLQSGIGIYRFSSQGFATFSGLMFEPVHFDMHLPSAWADKSLWLRLAQMVSYSAGLVIFPDGFSAGRFNATGSAARQIPGGEAIFEQALVFNVTRFQR